MKRAAAFLVLGVAISLVAVHAGQWFLVSGLRDWAALFAHIGIFLGATVGLAIVLWLLSLGLGGQRRADVLLLGVGAACGVVANPLADWVGKETWKLAYVRPAFASLCKDARVEVHPMDARADGLLLAGNREEHGFTLAEFVLNQSELPFVERLARRDSAGESKSPYERIEIEGERFRRHDPTHRGTQFKVTPITAPTAPLEARISLRAVAGEPDIAHRKVELARRSGGQPIVAASIYWHKGLERTCPESAAIDEIYTTNLLLRGMKMPEVSTSGR